MIEKFWVEKTEFGDKGRKFYVSAAAAIVKPTFLSEDLYDVLFIPWEKTLSISKIGTFENTDGLTFKCESLEECNEVVRLFIRGREKEQMPLFRKTFSKLLKNAAAEPEEQNGHIAKQQQERHSDDFGVHLFNIP